MTRISMAVTPFPDETAVALDRIFLAEHVRTFEIGAYAEEVGVVQRVRFDVTLEVAPDPRPVEDRVERVISYDDIVSAINTLVEGPRIKLLETLAEQLAELCLADDRARRVTVRLEKLDRLETGRLGVEIIRSRPG